MWLSTGAWNVLIVAKQAMHSGVRTNATNCALYYWVQVDSFAKAVATVLKSSGKSEPEADKEAEEIAENAPGDDEGKTEEDDEKPKKKAKSARGGKKK